MQFFLRARVLTVSLFLQLVFIFSLPLCGDRSETQLMCLMCYSLFTSEIICSQKPGPNTNKLPIQDFKKSELDFNTIPDLDD